MFKLTKTQRKLMRTGALNDKLLTPTQLEKGIKGYEFIMAVLSRGCDVSRA